MIFKLHRVMEINCIISMHSVSFHRTRPARFGLRRIRLRLTIKLRVWSIEIIRKTNSDSRTPISDCHLQSQPARFCWAAQPEPHAEHGKRKPKHWTAPCNSESGLDSPIETQRTRLLTRAQLYIARHFKLQTSLVDASVPANRSNCRVHRGFHRANSASNSFLRKISTAKQPERLTTSVLLHRFLSWAN